MAIPVAVLGFLQVAAGPQSSLNAYVSHSEDPAALVRFGEGYDLVRTSGTFSYISGYTAFLTFIAFLAMGYNMVQGWRLKHNLAALVALTLVVGAMFTTGSRAPVYTLIATTPVILWLAAMRGVLAFQTAMRLSILAPAILVTAVSVSPRAYQGFAERAAESSDTTVGRVTSTIYQTMEALSSAPALGMGIGTTHPSALTIMGVEWPWWLQGLFTEDEMARVTVEMGFIGLFLIYLLRILVAAFALRCAIAFKDPAYRCLGIALAVYLALGMVSSIMLNATANLYYWGALGVVITMRRLEQVADAEARAISAPSRRRFQSPAVRAN
jgi:hypothetical protein